MHRIAFSVLVALMALPAFADARLPVVNISAGSVSARAAFGDVPVASPAVKPVADVAPVVAVAPAPQSTKKVVSRAAVKKAPSVDAGGAIARNDVLIPNRPSADLWAKSDMPLRMPDPSEFSVLSDNYSLPEENLNGGTTTGSRVAVAPAMPVASVPTAAPATRPMADMDSQIARLVELQRRADEGARVAPVTTPTVASRPTTIANRAPIASAPVENKPEKAEVKLSRMVVPMSPDVVVRTVEKNTSPRIAAVRDDMTKMSPTELRKAFRKTFLSENKHLSTFQIDDRFDVASDMSSSIEGFTASRDLSEAGGIRPLEIKIRFRNSDSALSRENYNLLTEYASVVVSNPKRAIQVAIPQNVANDMDARKLAARRLAIVEQVLRDTGVSETRIMPVLAARNDDAFVLRVISSEQYETMTQQQRNIFGDTLGKKTYKSMSW